MRMQVQSLALPSGLRTAVSCGVGRRPGLELVWLCHRPPATALTGPLAWEPPHAVDAALKRQNKTKQNNKKKPHKLPKLSQDEKDNLISCITIK